MTVSVVSYEQPNIAEYETITDGILSAVLRNRRIGESLFETARRVLVHEVLAHTGGNQKAAGAILGISSRVMNYHCADLQLRPKDREAR
jgi:hypothetical protein